MKIALALIVKADDNEADYLNNCLKNVSPHVDGIFVTITGQNDKVKRVAEKYKANISYYDWDGNFSNARNYNFSQVPEEYDYIFWCDADDVFRGLENLRKIVEDNKLVDAFAMFYLYAFDEHKNPVVVHQKTQIVRNDGCVEWVGALHEDFKENRDLSVKFIKDVERIHTSDDVRFSVAKERNYKIAKEQKKDNPNDPRSFWNAGNAAHGIGEKKEALRNFKKFLEESESDEEKYIVRLRIAESYYILGEKEKAIEVLHKNIGSKPNYPDAYNLMGAFLLDMGKYRDAEGYLLLGLQKPQPKYSIVVFNPRDYDYQPLMNLSRVYFNLSRPDLALICLKQCIEIIPGDEKTEKVIKELEKEQKIFDNTIKKIKRISKIKSKEKLKKEIDNLKPEMRSHPAICNIYNTNFIKEESSGNDLVIFCGYTAKEWTPDVANKSGVGGSEEAVIHLSRGLAKLGWNVTVYNNCGYKEQEFDGVKYKPYWSWNYRDKQDVVILWRTPKFADYDINTDKLYVDVHDMIKPGEFSEKRLKKIDKIFFKSSFHRSVFPNVPNDKVVVVPNGIEADKYKGEFEKDKYLLINTSSPDRSLSALIRGFKVVKEKIPQAKCKWAYGWGVFDVVHGENEQMMNWKEEKRKEMEEIGIEELGMISHGDVENLYKKGKIFAYPSEFAEIDCISLTKAMAAGAIPVTTDFAAMGDKSGRGGYFLKSNKTKDNWCLDGQYDFSMENVKEWADTVIKILKSDEKPEERMRTFAYDFDWKNIINKWNYEICNTKK